MSSMNVALLHLCDSLFPIGGFGYSDGLESATASGIVGDVGGLRAWLDVCLDETIGRLEGPAVWRAHGAVARQDWEALVDLDEELTALRPSSSGRRSSRAMGARLVTTWQAAYPSETIDRLHALSAAGLVGPVLPAAFAAACVAAGIGPLEAVESYAYTRLAATISAAMRLMAIGQTGAHASLARAVARVPLVASAIAERNGRPEAFTPALDIAAMSQQYLHSRLFRS